MSYLLNYNAIAIFNEEYYKDLLTQNHLTDGETLFKTLSDSEGNELGKNIPGYPLQKGNIKYLLPSRTEDEDGARELNLNEDLPIIVKKKQKIYSGSTGYIHIKKYSSAKFRPEQRMTFRELVDKLSSSLSHSNTEHYKLYWMVALASMIDRVNIRLCTPPGFGKDSLVDIMGNLIGNATSITNPTVAKLEYLSYSKWLVLNEVVDVTPGDWRLSEQFLLDAGALKTQIAKRSRAIGGIGEFLDIKNLSLSLFYNDITEYTDSKKFFDAVTKGAVKDRFLPLRFHGSYTENFNEVSKIDLQEFVKENMGEYDDIIRTFVYYKHNINNSLHYYTHPETKLKERHKTALGKILKIVDVYSESQEEFNKWFKIIMDANQDYKEMLEFPLLVEQAIKKQGQAETERFINGLKIIDTFTEKKKRLNKFIIGEKIKVENEWW